MAASLGASLAMDLLGMSIGHFARGVPRTLPFFSRKSPLRSRRSANMTVQGLGLEKIISTEPVARSRPEVIKSPTIRGRPAYILTRAVYDMGYDLYSDIWCCYDMIYDIDIL